MSAKSGSNVRLDSVGALGPPRRLNDGSVVYEGILSVAEKPLFYPKDNREEIPTREALSDPTYLQSLVGLRLTYRHPSRLIDENDETEGIGTVIAARYEHPHVIVRIVVRGKTNQALVRKLRGLSEGYTTVLSKRNGRFYQDSRRPNHIALTSDGRSEYAGLRLDSRTGDKMDKAIMDALLSVAESFAKLKDAIGAYGSEEVVEMVEDSVESDVADVEASGDVAAADAGAMVEDSKAADRMDSLGDEIEGLLKLIEKGRSLGVNVTARRLAPARKELAKALGAEETRLDSADYCDGIISAAKVTKARSGDVQVTPAGSFKPLVTRKSPL